MLTTTNPMRAAAAYYRADVRNALDRQVFDLLEGTPTDELKPPVLIGEYNPSGKPNASNAEVIAAWWTGLATDLAANTA
jgi:hypothetical protein